MHNADGSAGKSGYYVAEKVIYDENEALQLTGWNIPTKICKRKI